MAKALNSPYYQLFTKPQDSHYLLGTSRKYANEFVKNLLSQRPLSFPEELKKRLKTEKENIQAGLFISSDTESKSEEKSDNEKRSVVDSEEVSQVGGIWEDGKESEVSGSEDVI